MSVIKASRAAGFMLLVMPNSLAALRGLLKSVPALAGPTTCAPEDCACSRNEEKSAAPSGTRTAPTFLPPWLSTTLEAAACSWVPKAESAVRENQLLPPALTMAVGVRVGGAPG